MIEGHLQMINAFLSRCPVPLGACTRSPSQNRFLIGQNRSGHWIARDENGLRGGVFSSRRDALHYALQETGGEAGGISIVKALELFPQPSPPAMLRAASIQRRHR